MPAVTAAPKRSTPRKRRRVAEPVRHMIAGHEIVKRVVTRYNLPSDAPGVWLDELARARREGLHAWLVVDPGNGRDAMLVTNPPRPA